MSSTRVFAHHSEPFDATVVPPGDKSLGHRALILAAIAEGDSVVANTSSGADVASTRAATALLGVEYADDHVTSPGIGAWSTPALPLDCGNSGTTMRLLVGAISGSPISATLIGDPSLLRRPMRRVVDPLAALGADVTVTETGTAPVRIRGTHLRGAKVSIPMASAQVRTAVALAALSADGTTLIESPAGFRDHTERWLTHLGLGRIESPTEFLVMPNPVPPLQIKLPADPSSAAFLWAAAAVSEGSRIVTPGVSLNPGRVGFLEILEQMGARVTVEPDAPLMGDPVGTVTVEAGGLVGIEVHGDLVARSLDEIPLLAVVAAAADGPTVVNDAGELRVKESDRIATSVALARVAGAEAKPTPDGFIVDPRPGQRHERIAIDAGGDHRVAMAAAIACLVRASTVDVTGFEVADISWPGFAEILAGLWS